ncbi:twin-arginine translocation signal domain-containing protein [Halorussus salinisoli]|uniref:twin-arginine translocation signal domain-containing protein n=1 Tax=Halorussus salinisoli TaxID=2558242 RepID=UPI0010C1941C|nr:twin-arginine translocation signal domain-containing protein [Halorussus salinisoli]
MERDNAQIHEKDESRRNFMKKGALASGAVALGLASTETAAAESNLQQQPSQALVFGYEYNPGISYEVISLLQQGTVDSVLGRQVGDDGRSIVQDTADYNGYVIRYQPDQAAGEYALVFVRDGSLQSGQTYQFGTDATFFNSQVNLITAGISTGGGGDGGDGG